MLKVCRPLDNDGFNYSAVSKVYKDIYAYAHTHHYLILTVASDTQRPLLQS